MISSLKGRIGWCRGGQVEVEVNGVGYVVFVGKNVFNEGEEVKLFTYLAVSENDMSLYGFKKIEDLDLFKMLITVSGVGPKSAANILANVDGGEIIRAIGEANVRFFEGIKGVGKKTAQRIIVDLKSKINSQDLDMSAFTEATADKEDDVVLSLVQLGFEKKEIDRVVKLVPKELMAIEERLSWCLANIK